MILFIYKLIVVACLVAPLVIGPLTLLICLIISEREEKTNE